MHALDKNGASKRKTQFMDVMANLKQYKTAYEKVAKQEAEQFYEGQQHLTPLCRLFREQTRSPFLCFLLECVPSQQFSICPPKFHAGNIDAA